MGRKCQQIKNRGKNISFVECRVKSSRWIEGCEERREISSSVLFGGGDWLVPFGETGWRNNVGGSWREQQRGTWRLGTCVFLLDFIQLANSTSTHPNFGFVEMKIWPPDISLSWITMKRKPRVVLHAAATEGNDLTNKNLLIIRRSSLDHPNSVPTHSNPNLSPSKNPGKIWNKIVNILTSLIIDHWMTNE